MTCAGRIIVIMSLRVVISALFAPAIVVKLQSPAVWAHLFTVWGYPSWGAIAVSVLEIIGLIALWTRFAVAAIFVLMTTLTGATATWLIHGPRVGAAYPGAILVLVASLAALERHRKRSHGHTETRPLEGGVA